MDPCLYPTDLSDAQWERIRMIFPRAKNGRTGRPRTYPLRQIVNALLYQLRTGCQWRMLPREYPPWASVYDHFRRWRRDSTLERIQDALREQVRQAEGRETSPSAAILDSQLVKTTGKRGDAGATTRGRRSPGESATSS